VPGHAAQRQARDLAGGSGEAIPVEGHVQPARADPSGDQRDKRHIEPTRRAPRIGSSRSPADESQAHEHPAEQPGIVSAQRQRAKLDHNRVHVPSVASLKGGVRAALRPTVW